MALYYSLRATYEVWMDRLGRIREPERYGWLESTHYVDLQSARIQAHKYVDKKQARLRIDILDDKDVLQESVLGNVPTFRGFGAVLDYQTNMVYSYNLSTGEYVNKLMIYDPEEDALEEII